MPTNFVDKNSVREKCYGMEEVKNKNINLRLYLKNILNLRRRITSLNQFYS